MKKYLILFLILFPVIVWGADSKITALTEDTAPTSDDLVVTVNAPGSSPANRKATLANLFKWALVPGGSTNVTTITGDYAFGITLTDTTNVTFPTSGTLATTAGTLANTVLDDTKGNGDTAFVWSADKVYDQLAGKAASNAATTVNSQPCTLGSSCTVTANLPANPSPCDSGKYVTDIGADGTLTCDTPTGAAHDAVTLSGDPINAVLGLSTQALSLDTQTANYIFAGPASGDPAAPAFRALVSADIPNNAADTSGTAAGITGDLDPDQLTGDTVDDNLIDAALLPIPTNITVADTTDTTSYVGLFESATGDLGPKTDAGITYNAGTGMLTVTGLTTGSGGITTAATAAPTNLFSDSDAPGADKEIGKIVGGYVDGADGSENGTIDINVHQAGTTTSYVQLDGKNVQVEINKPLVLLSSDDPDTSAANQMTFDTDGWLRVYSTSQKALARIQEEIHVTVYKPNDMDDAQRDHFWIWSNESGMSFIVTGWKGWSTSDDTTLTIYEEDADGANDATVDAVELATGSGPYTGSDTTITGATIENGHLVYLDFDNTDAPALVKITIYGYYNADVN